MQVRGGYSSMAGHALNGLVGSVDNVGGTVKATKEYTLLFRLPDEFIDETEMRWLITEKLAERGFDNVIKHYQQYKDPETGQIECHAKLWEGVRPGTVAKCYGQGHWAYGRVASKEFGKVPLGGNNNVIIPAVYDRLSGSTAFYGITRVKIVKVG